MGGIKLNKRIKKKKIKKEIESMIHDVKVGDIFTVKSNSGFHSFDLGTIVELVDDDGSDCKEYACLLTGFTQYIYDSQLIKGKWVL
jgi:hypothetical protein